MCIFIKITILNDSAYVPKRSYKIDRINTKTIRGIYKGANLYAFSGSYFELMENGLISICLPKEKNYWSYDRNAFKKVIDILKELQTSAVLVILNDPP